jgi:hypothetical protein
MDFLRYDIALSKRPKPGKVAADRKWTREQELHNHADASSIDQAHQIVHIIGRGVRLRLTLSTSQTICTPISRQLPHTVSQYPKPQRLSRVGIHILRSPR